MTRRHARGSRLLLHDADRTQEPQAVAAAAERVLTGLRDELSDLIGAGGVAALAGRALHLAQRESALLEGVQTLPDGSFTGLAEALRSAEAPAAEAAGAALIDQYLGLLVALMGEDVGLRPVRRRWPGVDLDRDFQEGPQ